MSEQILEQLFDSPIKVKLLKLFLRNPDRYFSLPEIAKKTQGRKAMVEKQVRGLASIGFLRSKKVKSSRKKQIAGGRYFAADQNFDFYGELESLVLKSSPTSKDKMLKKILRLGRIKMALIGGIFLNTDNSRVDLFLVGDDVSAKKLRNFLAEMESEVGREIEYAAMDTKEFDYRFHMFDGFVRDILEKPHEKLINKIRFVE
jgi:biotin operon repressor